MQIELDEDKFGEWDYFGKAASFCYGHFRTSLGNCLHLKVRINRLVSDSSLRFLDFFCTQDAPMSSSFEGIVSVVGLGAIFRSVCKVDFTRSRI